MNPQNHRRLFLKGSLSASVVGIAVSAGLFTAKQVYAALPESALKAKTVAEAINAVFGSEQTTETDQITISSPAVAENGATVPVTVETTLTNVQTIAILSSKNAAPLTQTTDFHPGVRGYLSTRIKVGQSGDLIAVIKADGKLFSASKPVKVTVGGCT